MIKFNDMNYENYMEISESSYGNNIARFLIYTPTTMDEVENAQLYAFSHGYIWRNGAITPLYTDRSYITMMIFDFLTKEITASTVRTDIDELADERGTLPYIYTDEFNEFKIKLKSESMVIPYSALYHSNKNVYESTTYDIYNVICYLPNSPLDCEEAQTFMFEYGFDWYNGHNEVNYKDAKLLEFDIKTKGMSYSTIEKSMDDTKDEYNDAGYNAIVFDKLSKLKKFMINKDNKYKQLYDTTDDLVYESKWWKKKKKEPLPISMIAYNIGENDDVKKLLEFLFESGYSWGNQSRLIPDEVFNSECIVILPYSKRIKYAPTFDDLNDYIAQEEYEDEEYIIFYNLYEFKNYIRKPVINYLYNKKDKLVYEGKTDKISADVYVFYVKDEKHEDVYNFIFKHGYTWPDNQTDIARTDYNAAVIFFNKDKNEITYSSRTMQTRDLEQYMIDYLDGKSYYVFEDFTELKTILSPSAIDFYNKPRNLVYESLGNIKIIDLKLPEGLDAKQKNYDYLISKGYRKASTTLETNIITQRLDRTNYFHIFLDTKLIIFLCVETFSEIISMMTSYNIDDIREVSNIKELRSMLGDPISFDDYYPKKELVYEHKIKKLKEY